MGDENLAAQLQVCVVDCLECYGLCRQAGTSGVLADCAEVCRTTADLLLRQSPFFSEICALCAEICEACATELERSGGPVDCVRACRGCAASCRRFA